MTMPSPSPPVVFLVPLLLLLLVSVACSKGPTEIIPWAFSIPGGRMSGEPATAASWDEVVEGSGIFDLETRPADPYSVRIGFVMRDGRIDVDPADGRKWLPPLEADSHVRVRIDGRIYRALAIPVADPAELEGFDPMRHV